MAIPSFRQRDDVLRTFEDFSASCDNFDKEAAIAACENGIRAFKVMLTVLGGPGSGASCTSSSEESASDRDIAFDDDGDCDDSESDDDYFDDADDGGSGSDYADDGGSGYDDADDSDDDDDGDSDDGDNDVGDSASSSSSSSDEGDLVADYSGNADPSRYCDQCGYSGHTNQYCPTLPAPKRRRL